MKKFRKWNVSRVIVVKEDYKQKFEQELEKILEEYIVVDMHYSYNGDYYTALVLVVRK